MRQIIALAALAFTLNLAATTIRPVTPQPQSQPDCPAPNPVCTPTPSNNYCGIYCRRSLDLSAFRVMAGL